MTLSPLIAAFIQGNYDHTSGPNGTITRVVVHGTVSPTVRGGARAIARYFQRPDAGGLANYVVDPGETIGCCDEDICCWAAPPNLGSVHIEFCDVVDGDPARWQDADHQAMLARGAALCADICRRRAIPTTHVGPGELLAGQWGVPGHVDVAQAWHESDHHDPGDGFPWGQLMALVTAAGTTPAPVPQGDDDMPHWLSTTDPTTGGTWTVSCQDGSVYTDEGAPFLGGLNTHPDWHAIDLFHPIVAIEPWRGNTSDTGGNGYKIGELDPNPRPGAGPIRWYRFSRDGRYR